MKQQTRETIQAILRQSFQDFRQLMIKSANVLGRTPLPRLALSFIGLILLVSLLPLMFIIFCVFYC